MSGFISIGHLPRVPRYSRLAANARGDNEMILEMYTDIQKFTLSLKNIPENLIKETIDEG